MVRDVGYFAYQARDMGSNPIREQSRSSSWLGHVQFLRCLFPVIFLILLTACEQQVIATSADEVVVSETSEQVFMCDFDVPNNLCRQYGRLSERKSVEMLISERERVDVTKVRIKTKKFVARVGRTDLLGIFTYTVDK